VLAARCVVEGDATCLMNAYMAAKVPALRDLGGALGGGAGMDLEQMAAMQPGLAGKPRALWMPLVYPYVGGLQFVQRAHAAGGWAAVDALFRDLPASSEQVLHPDKYFTPRRDAPVRLRFDALPAADAWTLLEENTLGELLLGIWLREQGAARAVADRAAAGWGGDRYRAWALPDGATAAVLATTWDTAADARDFERAAQAAGVVVAADRRVVVVRGLSGEAARALAEAALAALATDAAPSAPVPAVPDRVTGDGFGAATPGEGWRIAAVSPEGPFVFEHGTIAGARIVVTRRGPATEARPSIDGALDGLRRAGVSLERVQRLRVGETSATSCEARFTADGEDWVLVADLVGGRLVTVVGRAPAGAAEGGLVAAVRRVAAGLRVD
jgi:hypothetical protein